MQSVPASMPAVFTVQTSAASRCRRIVLALTVACIAWLSGADGLGSVGVAGNVYARETVKEESSTNVVAAPSGSNDPLQRHKELTDALQKAAEAERRLNQRAEQLNSEMARLLNKPESQQLLHPAPIVELSPATAPDAPLRLRMDHAIAHLPEPANDYPWLAASGPGFMGALAAVAAIIAAAAIAWLLIRARAMHRMDQASQKTWPAAGQLQSDTAPALPFHQG